MSTVMNTLMTLVVPIAGCVSGNLIALSSLKEMVSIQKQRKLGAYDPFPLTLGFLNALTQLLFAFIIKDSFVFAGNVLGFLLTFWYLMVSMSAKDLDNLLRLRMHLILLIGLAIIMVAYFVCTVVLLPGGMVLSADDKPFSDHLGRMIFGYMGLVFLSFFYVSPLLTIAKVVKEKNSAYFFMPLAIACLINGALWAIYGFATGMEMVYLPNMFGALIAIIQLICCFVYPRKSLVASAPEMTQTPFNGGRRRSLLPEHMDDTVSDSASVLSTSTKGDELLMRKSSSL